MSNATLSELLQSVRDFDGMSARGVRDAYHAWCQTSNKHKLKLGVDLVTCVCAFRIIKSQAVFALAV